MDFLIQTLWPDIVVITKLDRVHVENFPGGLQQLWQEKWKLALAARDKVYYNGNDPYALDHLSLLSVPTQAIFTKDFSPSLSLEDNRIVQTFSYKKKQISLDIPGKESVVYTALGLDIAEDVSLPLTSPNYAFHFELQPGRLSVFERGENLFIDSSYNASPESMRQVIVNVEEIQKHIFPEKKLIFVV